MVQLADFGLAKWNTGDDSHQTRIMGTFGWEFICSRFLLLPTTTTTTGLIITLMLLLLFM